MGGQCPPPRQSNGSCRRATIPQIRLSMRQTLQTLQTTTGAFILCPTVVCPRGAYAARGAAQEGKRRTPVQFQ
eukprot:15445389-Alexandrium_andersonii.AAC.1